MTLAEDMVHSLQAHEWRQVVTEQGDRRLELNPLHGMLGAGFTLFKRADGGDWEPVASGHTEGDGLVTPEGTPWVPSDNLVDALENLLDAMPG